MREIPPGLLKRLRLTHKNGDSRMEKKILVLSISSWNSATGMDSWPTLLEGRNPDCVANICLRGETPDSSACNHYFYISENKVIKSIINRSVKTGSKREKTVQSTDINADLTKQKTRYQKMRKHRSFFPLMAREILWKVGKWKSRELYDFITEFSPDVILYSMDGYIHFNRLCRYAKKVSGAKSIGFFVDDNFTYKQSKRLDDRVFRFFQRRALKRLARETDAFWAITDMTKEEADKVFGINCTVLTKPVRSIPVYEEKKATFPIQILYTGNLLIGRDQSLIKVVNALKEIPESAEKFTLDVYTNTMLEEAVKQAISCDICRLHPPIPKEEVLELQKEADILLFLEDIDGPNAKTARLSFSTKITDYLSAGKSIFAVGCMDTAPMQYFVKNRAAIVASSEHEIRERLEEIRRNPDILSEYAKQTCEVGKKNHDKKKILQIVEDTICQVLDK